MNILALVLMGVSKAHVFNALAPASVILGLAGITFHLSQLHVASLFPRRKGLVASLLVAGFTGCGIVFYIMLQINNYPRSAAQQRLSAAQPCLFVQGHMPYLKLPQRLVVLYRQVMSWVAH